MNKQPTTSKSGALSRFFKVTFSAGLLTASVLLLSGHTSQAGSVMWNANPTSGDWTTAANWTPTTVPNGFFDIATFDFSSTTDVSLASRPNRALLLGVSGIVFKAGASAFTITLSPDINDTVFFDIGSSGIVNNSGITQNFRINNNAEITFFVGLPSEATAGSPILFTNYGLILFRVAHAGNATFINKGGTARAAARGFTGYYNTSSAGNGVFVNEGGEAIGTEGGALDFRDASTAGNGTFTTNGGTVSGAGRGILSFYNTSSAANATLIANGGLNGGEGGSIYFDATLGGNPTGGSARVALFGNGNLDISRSDFREGVTVGSIEGDGNVFLGSSNLTVGRSNLNTNFSGVIQDGVRNRRRGGSFTKIGTGKLVLGNGNTYTGRTNVKGGKLLINNKGGSGTGSGPVQVKGGKLGGKGTIAGPVTVGTGTGAGAILAPGYVHGIGSPGALTIQSPLTFNSDATYEAGINSSSVMADEVVAIGVTINGGAQFAFADIGSGILPANTVFTVINNTAATPIAGAFSNLPDGATFTSNGNSFKANYQGGNGNDLTLKVEP